MANVMPSHHGGYEGDEPPRYPPTIPGNCQSAPPLKRRKHSKSLTVF